MFPLNLDERADLFFDELKAEIIRQIGYINANAPQDEPAFDEFWVDNIEDGWIRYKGMSWGFALLHKPPRMTFTFGPDQPFVGHQEVLIPQLIGSQIVWINSSNSKGAFASARSLARYGLERLAGKCHDKLPTITLEIDQYRSQGALNQPNV
ncbi:MAG TPA: hypothetical protein V6D17_20330 [Candidatus Obscuribacterales bacterium]